MGWVETRVAQLERRIEKVNRGSDPYRLKSNAVLYEAQLDQVKYLKKARDEGRPFVGCGAPQLLPLFRGMGFEPGGSGVREADLLVSGRIEECFDRVRALGLPDYACDRTIVGIPLVVDGELPRPDVFINVFGSCENVGFGCQALASILGIPTFNIDVPFEDEYKDNITYVADQVWSFIKFAEATVPGVKYDEARTLELQALHALWHRYYREVYELCKNVPCPAPPRDVVRECIWPCEFGHPAMAALYPMAFAEELQERVEKGLGGVPEEKLRFIWAISAPYYSTVFDLLSERGVSVVYYEWASSPRIFQPRYGNYFDTREFGRRLTPVEEASRGIIKAVWSGTAQRWVEDLLYVSREFKADAIVHFTQMGCTHAQGLAKLLGDAAEKELGIPTLQIFGRQLEPTSFPEGDFLRQMNDFIDLCMRRKGLA